MGGVTALRMCAPQPAEVRLQEPICPAPRVQQRRTHGHDLCQPVARRRRRCEKSAGGHSPATDAHGAAATGPLLPKHASITSGNAEKAPTGSEANGILTMAVRGWS